MSFWIIFQHYSSHSLSLHGRKNEKQTRRVGEDVLLCGLTSKVKSRHFHFALIRASPCVCRHSRLFVSIEQLINSFPRLHFENQRKALKLMRNFPHKKPLSLRFDLNNFASKFMQIFAVFYSVDSTWLKFHIFAAHNLSSSIPRSVHNFASITKSSLCVLNFANSEKFSIVMVKCAQTEAKEV